MSIWQGGENGWRRLNLGIDLARTNYDFIGVLDRGIDQDLAVCWQPHGGDGSKFHAGFSGDLVKVGKRNPSKASSKKWKIFTESLDLKLTLSVILYL